MVALVLLGIVIVMGILAACGRAYDSRDPDYGLGRVIRGPENRPPAPSGR